MSNIVTIFNTHFAEFLQDVQNVFPDDVDIKTANNSLLAIRKANPKILMKIWNKYVAIPYKDHIERGDIEFFISKDYSTDFKNNDHSDKIMSSINRLREPIKMMGAENRAKTMKYMQNLSKLSLMAV